MEIYLQEKNRPQTTTDDTSLETKQMIEQIRKLRNQLRVSQITIHQTKGENNLMKESQDPILSGSAYSSSLESVLRVDRNDIFLTGLKNC